MIRITVVNKSTTGGQRVKLTAVMLNVHAAVQGAAWGFGAGTYSDALRR